MMLKLTSFLSCIAMAIFLLPSTASAALVCLEFEACVTFDFSTGPCIGLNPVGEMVFGTIRYDDSVADSDPTLGEGSFMNSIISFDFTVGSSMGSVDGTDFMFNTIDSDSLGANEKLLLTLLNPSDMQVPAGMNISLSGLFFQLLNSGTPVFTDPDSLTGITGIYDQFDATSESRFQVIGECTDSNDPNVAGTYGFEANIKSVRVVPEPNALALLFFGTLAGLAWHRR